MRLDRGESNKEIRSLYTLYKYFSLNLNIFKTINVSKFLLLTKIIVKFLHVRPGDSPRTTV